MITWVVQTAYLCSVYIDDTMLHTGSSDGHHVSSPCRALQHSLAASHTFLTRATC